MKKEQLNKKHLKEIKDWLDESSLVCTFSKKDKVEKLNDSVLTVNGDINYIIHATKIYPSLKLVLKEGIDKFNCIFVDEGAVKFMVNGADLMRPGITEINSNIKKDDFIVIVDAKHKQPLAVGISNYDTEEMKKLEKGKVAKNIHFVGDDIWNEKF